MISIWFASAVLASVASGDEAATPEVASTFDVIEQPDSIVQYFRELKDRRLYSIAETAGEYALRDLTLTPVQVELYRMELAQTYAAHAQSVIWKEAEGLWQEANEVLKTTPPNPRLVQEAVMLEALKVQHLGEIIKLPGVSAVLKQEYQLALPIVRGKLRQLIKDIEEEQQVVDINPVQTSKLDHREVRLELVRLLLGRAEFPQIAPSELSQILDVVTNQLGLVKATPLNPGWGYEAELLKLKAARLSGDQDLFRRLEKRILATSKPPHYQNMIAAERVRYEMATGKPTVAAGIVTELKKQLGVVTPELRGLRLQALCEMSELLRQEGEAELSQNLISEVERRIELLKEENEQFVVQQVERSLARVRAVQQYGPEIAELLNQAQTLVRQQNAGAAWNLYQQALESAMKEQRVDLLVPLGLQLSAFALQTDQNTKAVSALENLWTSSPNLPQMEEIHLAWIEALEVQYRSSPSIETWNKYSAAIDDHLKRYPERSTQDQIRWKLAERHYAVKQYQEAIKSFQATPSSSALFPNALLRIGQCYQAWITTELDPAIRSEIENSGVRWAQQLIVSVPEDALSNATWAEAYFQAGRFLLDFFNGDSEESLNQANASLRAKLESQREFIEPEKRAAFKAWDRVLSQLELIIAVQAGVASRALELLKTSTAAPQSGSRLMYLLRMIEKAPEPDLSRRSLKGHVILELIRMANESAIPIPSQNESRLRQYQAEAKAMTGKLDDAIEIYRELADGKPASDPLVSRLTSYYEECGNQKCALERYLLWKQIAERARQGTDDWQYARYELARAALASGKQDEARKLLSVLQILHPAGESELWKERYQSLANLLK